MTKSDLERLLPEGEWVYLDWKMDFPPELTKGRPQREWDRGRGKLLRSLVAFANSHGSAHAHLVYGVEDLGAERRIHGISRSFDDADFQQWAEKHSMEVGPESHSVLAAPAELDLSLKEHAAKARLDNVWVVRCPFDVKDAYNRRVSQLTSATEKSGPDRRCSR